MPDTLRMCENPDCRALLFRRANEDSGKFNKRKYCCQPCTYSRTRGKRAVDISPKKCLHCGDEIPTDFGDRPKRANEYAKQKFCCYECSADYRKVAGKKAGIAGVGMNADTRRSLRIAHLESTLYGGEKTDAYHVGYIRRVEPFSRGRPDAHSTAQPG